MLRCRSAAFFCTYGVLPRAYSFFSPCLYLGFVESPGFDDPSSQVNDQNAAGQLGKF